MACHRTGASCYVIDQYIPPWIRRRSCLKLTEAEWCIYALIIHQWFRRWLVAWSAPSHYLNQCWNIVNWNKLQWNHNRNSYIFIQENAFENVVRKLAAILSRPQYVKSNTWVYDNEPQLIPWMFIAQTIFINIAHKDDDLYTYIHTLATCIQSLHINIWYKQHNPFLHPGDVRIPRF